MTVADAVESICFFSEAAGLPSPWTINLTGVPHTPF